MIKALLKSYLPRGIYGRATLILIVPIITIQLVVSIMFLQRHFEDVTRQMTQTVVRDLELVRTQKVKPSDLGIVRTTDAKPEADQRAFYDLSGLVVMSVLYEAFPDISGIALDLEENVVRIGFEEQKGAYLVERRKVSASNPHQLLVLMVFTALIMTLVSVLFLRNQMRPIYRLGRAAEAFGRGQSVSYRPSGAREVRMAGQAFLEMRKRIERFVEQRTLLLSGVSHDLRTPLTRMRLSLSLMEGEEVEGLEGDVKEMQSMIDAFLEFTRAETAEQMQETDLVSFCQKIAEDFGRLNQHIELWGLEEIGSAKIRQIAIKRALENLLRNAHRHGTRVALHVTHKTKSLHLAVEDNGCGIAKEEREKATEPFTRLEEARNSGEGSVGLGLAIVRDIARAHGGYLLLDESRTLGGLKATIVLPL